MTRKKKGTVGGTAPEQKRTQPRRRGVNNTRHLPQPKTEPPSGQFSLRDEARNTDRSSWRWSGDTKLRHKHVNFVSAGKLQGADTERASPRAGSSRDQTTSKEAFNSSPVNMSPSPEILQNARSDQDVGAGEIVVDTIGTQQQVKTDFPPPTVRSPSPSLSSSSEDVVIFKGRGQRPVLIQDDPPAQKVLAGPALVQQLHMQAFKSSRNEHPPPQKRPYAQESEDALADYLVNIREQETLLRDEADSTFRLRDLTIDDTGSLGEAEASSASSSGEDSVSNENDVEWNHHDQQVEHFTDEQLARLLSTQEELGLGSPELFLWDDLAVEDQGYKPPAGTNKNKSPGKARATTHKQRKGEFPSASLMADVLEQDPYNGFDVMDYERPSLKMKAKGRKDTPQWDVSDEELQSTMQRSWEVDREKKRAKKLERETLRSQQHLGLGNDEGTSGLRSGDVTDMNRVLEEIRLFVASSHQRHSLPPMDKTSRARVHRIAVAYKLTSSSRGSGKSRFTTLIKTPKTLTTDDPAFQRKEGQFIKKTRFTTGKSAINSGPMLRASYKDGDVVGAAAPELGQDNRGRAMLEKMGWTKGTALGANNKGILLPVTHVVKNSKLGLG